MQVRQATALDLEALAHVWHDAWHDAHAHLVPQELNSSPDAGEFSGPAGHGVRSCAGRRTTGNAGWLSPS